MGYYSRITGAITIEPALTWKEIEESGFLPASCAHECVVLRLHEEQRPGEGGTMLVRWADAIVPVSDESRKFYELEDEVRAIVAAYRKGHKFGGYLEVSGEEQGDLWRLYVRDGNVVRVTPKVVWPEEGQ